MIDRMRVVRGLALALISACAVASAAVTASAADPAAQPSGVVNLNTATAEELQLLPGIGASRAQAVIALRKERGGFKSLDELKDVKGIGDSSLERLRPFVRLDGKTTAK
jgi:competence protein ComEA